MEMPKYATALCILVLVLGKSQANISNSCVGLITLGSTYPSGDITLEYGEPLSITCVLNDSILATDGKNASQDLHFVRNGENNPLSRELVEIINSTSIRLYIERPNQVSDDNYKCYYKNVSEMVCFNVVTVGVKPQTVTDFSCIGRNYENLNCTWTAPDNNVKTNYSLEFRLKGRAPRQPLPCPNITKNGSTMSCVWTMSSIPPYRPAQPLLNFTLFMTNQFGNNSLNYLFDHFKYVIPNAPQHLNASATSPHSIQLSWQLPSSMKTFPPGVHHRILYQCEYYPKEWQFGGLITNQTKSENITFVLTNLKYAHALCDIRVSMRSAKADPKNEWAWSEYATRTERTQSKEPDGPPETNVGSFRFIEPFGSKRHVLVHWKPIREEARNGQDFKYKVEIENTGSTNYTFKPFIKLSNLTAQEYKINIWSKNDKGISSEKSTLVIPAQRLPEPQRFIRIVHPDLIELKWDPPKSALIITNYTIFWCPDNDNKYDCDGYLDWVTVPGNTTQYNLTLPKKIPYRIAISANGKSSSSGMLWEECTLYALDSNAKLKSVWIKEVGSNFIEVEWKIDCADHITAAQGFIIYYCQIEKAQTACIDKMKNVTIMNKNNRKHTGRVENLKPYRTYQLMVAVIIRESEISQPSDPMYNTTKEAAPSTPPLNVRVTNITESSITVNWNPPLEENGKLEYHLNVSGKIYHIRDKINNFTVNDLVSYGTYLISLSACTIECSNSSIPMNITTKMGVPGAPGKPFILDTNSSLITITWHKPNDPRGKNDYYQLKFANKIGITNQSEEPYINVTSMTHSRACPSKYTYDVYVRAVNIIGNKHKYGEWSKPLQLNNCTSPSQVLYIIVTILFIFFVAAVYFGFKKLYFYFNSMKDVQVKLPPGLQTVVDQQPWSSTKHSEDIDRSPNPDPDEELLLDKFPDSHHGVDISGMTSPHDTASSLEPVPHLTTDLTKKTSLRQRNKTTSDVSKTPQPGNYSVLGVDPNKTLTTETRYLPGLDDDAPTPAYVTVDDIVKMPNPGYIPYTVAEPEEKNKGYVMAGMPKDLLVHDLLQCDTQTPFKENTGYVRASDNFPLQKGDQFSWEQPPLEAAVLKSGYVSVGDALPPKNVSDISKGYIPHRQFDATKSIKED